MPANRRTDAPAPDTQPTRRHRAGQRRRTHPAASRQYRSGLGRLASGLTTVLFSPVWLVLWLQSRHNSQFDVGPLESDDLPTVDQLHDRAMERLALNRQRIEAALEGAGGAGLPKEPADDTLSVAQAEGLRELQRYFKRPPS